jgi:hypothetical protein
MERPDVSVVYPNAQSCRKMKEPFSSGWLDGLGIPTIELCMKHSTDECKSNTCKRKRKKKTAAVEGAPARKFL